MQVGILGIHFKTANLALHELMARSALAIFQEKALFPMVLLSTCNRTEIYFSAENLRRAKHELQILLQSYAGVPLDLYAYFEKDCFIHLCRVASGLDSAIFLETEIARQVKAAYSAATSRFKLPSSLHYLFQKSFKVAKSVRHHFSLHSGSFVLFDTLWHIAESELSDLGQKKVFLIGYSETHRNFAEFLMKKGVRDITFCSRQAEKIGDAKACSREHLSDWNQYDLISCATQSDTFLVQGLGRKKHLIFDLSVPRNVDPSIADENTTLLNIAEINRRLIQKKDPLILQIAETFLEENVARLLHLYLEKISLAAL